MKLYLAEQDKNHAMVLAFVPKITLGAGMTISILGLLGGFVAMFTLGWRILDQLKAYLHIEIAADMIGNHAVKLKTAIENRQFSARKIDGAFLLVSPLDEDPEESVRKIFSYNRLKHMFSSSNEMVRVITRHMKQSVSVLEDGSGRILIPLPYYTLENVDVGDERLQYEHVITNDKLAPGLYAARFYIDATRRLHRLVHASFIMGKERQRGKQAQQE